jgi:hypothetical protein
LFIGSSRPDLELWSTGFYVQAGAVPPENLREGGVRVEILQKLDKALGQSL